MYINCSYFVCTIYAGDVDSCDDNESERHSNRSSNHTPVNNSQRRLRRNNNFHNHSTAVGVPPNTLLNHSASPISHHNVPINSLYSTDMHNIGAPSIGGGGSANYINSAMLLDNKMVHNDLDLISNGNGIDGQTKTNAGCSSGANNVLNRQIRMRAYGNGKSGMVRHETKL